MMQIVIEIPEENYQVTLTKIMLACRGCSIIELPKWHGRLIDADEILRELGSYHIGGLNAIKNYNGENTWEDGLHTAWRVIDDAETIIPAESEVENAEQL